MFDALKGILAVDIETASAAEIKFGAWSYSLHESTKVHVVVFSYARGKSILLGHTYYRWCPGDNLHPDVLDFIRAGGPVLAHNVSFERAIWTNILIPLFNFPVINDDQWLDTQAVGLALNLPAALEGLAKALGCPTQKDTGGGAKLMRRLSKAEADGKGGWRYSPATDEEKEALAVYCERDVGATLDAWFLIVPLSVTEILVWRADQRINARGVYLDQEFADKLSRLADQRTAELADETFIATDGELENSTSSPTLKKWLKKQGVTLPLVTRKKKDGTFHKTESAGALAIKDLLAKGELSPVTRQVLENRVEANRVTSLAKLSRIEPMVGADGRLRNALQFCGAFTGRWASYGLQLHNFPKDDLTPEASALARLFVDLVCLEGIKLTEDRPLEIMSQLLRSVIAAPPGREIIAGDYSAIEARIIAWLAGQEDILEQFVAGVDVYMYTAEAIGSDSYPLGKLCTLALGYGMGILKLSEKAAGKGVVLSLKEFRRVHRTWRETNVQIVQFWHDMDDAAMAAIENPRTVFEVGFIRLVSSPSCLRMILPSGRELRYWRPHIVHVVKTIQTVNDDGVVVEREFETDEIRYYVQAPNKASMIVESTYGAKLAEHATQGVARDLLGEAIVRIEGVDPYDIVMHVHDSIATEVPAGQGDVDQFCGLMARTPSWAGDLPVAVKGYRDVRFRG